MIKVRISIGLETGRYPAVCNLEPRAIYLLMMYLIPLSSGNKREFRVHLFRVSMNSLFTSMVGANCQLTLSILGSRSLFSDELIAGTFADYEPNPRIQFNEQAVQKLLSNIAGPI